MKTNELRIGNLFQEKYTGQTIKVLELTKDNVTFSGSFPKLWQAVKIPITEEWLLKIKGVYVRKYRWHGNDYDYQPGDHWTERDDYIISKDYFISVERSIYNRKLEGVFVRVYRNEWYAQCRENPVDAPLEYVHQLQNLYFALTGQELEINP